MLNHNNPPDMAVTALETMQSLSAWMAENPAVTETSAREAKVFIDRGKLCIKDLEDERDGKVRPLNEQVKEINGRYKTPRETLQKVLDELERRLAVFLQEEKRRRIEAADAAIKLAEEAEARAREAERIEQEAVEAAKVGELGVDIGSVTVLADDAFRDFQVAARTAARAEKETNVKIGGGFSRALGLRSKEELIVVDLLAAIQELGGTEDIKEAVIKSSRAYRKLHNKLPPGVVSHIEEGI